jgi:hypothetical protein
MSRLSLSPIRTELEVLLNEPVRLKLGTAEHPFTVEIREPTNAELGEYMLLMNGVLTRFVLDNGPFLRAALAGDTVSERELNFGALETALTVLVAKVCGLEPEYVRETMSARQSAAVLKAFLDVLGWEFLKETFLSAMRAYQKADAKQQQSAGPAWPSESSPNSAPGTQD